MQHINKGKVDSKISNQGIIEKSRILKRLIRNEEDQ
jgi:hypothetical protein